jgi:isopentenyldiphosphate isomerase
MKGMEKFDLVDENDQIIGETDKATSHIDGGIHRVVAIFVFDNEGRLYVQEHLKSGGKLDHSVGGHVIKGESYEEAAYREGKEELGLNCDLKLVTKFFSDETYSGKNIRHYFGIFECNPGTDWKFISNEEVKNIVPMSVSEIVETMNTEPVKFTPGFLNTMREYVLNKKLPFLVKDYRGTRLNYQALN